jgi:hypothetical protein
MKRKRFTAATTGKCLNVHRKFHSDSGLSIASSSFKSSPSDGGGFVYFTKNPQNEKKNQHATKDLSLS